LSEELITIGKIVGHFGYKGEVKVTPLTDFPERFNVLQQVKVNKRGQIFTKRVESLRSNANGFLFKLSDIDSKETAQEFRGSLLQIEETEVYPLPEGYYYHFQLKGLQVHDIRRGLLGELIDVLETGANDVYVIKSSLYGEILIPAIKEVIIKVDLENKMMQVDLLPGIIDDEG
jgi:16S rRNA processing protein RimM